MNLMSIFHCLLSGCLTPSGGGGSIALYTLGCLQWHLISSVHQVCKIFILKLGFSITFVVLLFSYINRYGASVFWRLPTSLIYRNHLSPSSICAILCFSDWSQKDLVHMPELVEILEDCQSKKCVLEVDLTVEV